MKKDIDGDYDNSVKGESECCENGVCRPDEIIKQPKITKVSNTSTKKLSLRNK